MGIRVKISIYAVTSMMLSVNLKEVGSKMY